MQRAGNKTTLTAVAISNVSATQVAVIPSLGARKILVRIYGSSLAHNVTLSGEPSFDGVNPVDSTSFDILVNGGPGPGNNAQGLLIELLPNVAAVAGGEMEFSCPFVQVKAQIATAPATMNFDIWVFRDHWQTNVQASLP